MSRDPPCKDSNDRFTTVPFKLFLSKNVEDCIKFLPITCLLTGLKNMIFIKVQRTRMQYQFQMNNKTSVCTYVSLEFICMYRPHILYPFSFYLEYCILYDAFMVCVHDLFPNNGRVSIAIENYTKSEFPL